MKLWRKDDPVNGVVVPPMGTFIAAPHTPDLVELENAEYRRLFVPDEMMSRHHRFGLIKDHLYPMAPIVALTQTKFSMVRCNRRSPSTVVPLRMPFADTPRRHVRGELYGVKSSRFVELDIYKRNGVEFRRTRVNLIIPMRRLSQQYWTKERDRYSLSMEAFPYEERTIDAFMYVGKAKFWEPLLTEQETYYKRQYADFQSWNGKYTLRLENGEFRKKLGSHYSPVKHFKPYNKNLEEYYYFAPDDTAGLVRNGKFELATKPKSSYDRWDLGKRVDISRTAHTL